MQTYTKRIRGKSRRQFFFTCVLTFSLSGVFPGVVAQTTWSPTQPIRVVVPFSPGGGSDTLIRSIGPGLSESLGQSVVIENRPGASGSIGSDAVYRAPPDGYTLLVASLDAQSMAPHLQNVNFDASKFTLLGGIASMGYALMGRSDLPANTLPELLKLMKEKELTYASGGAGSSLHIFTEQFAKEAGAKMLHVPFSGAGPGLLALLGGQVDLMMVPIAAAPQHLSKLKTFGITPAKRVDSMKDVPTLSEQGVNVVGASWMGLVAPPGTPDNVAATVASAVGKVVATPETKKKLMDMGMTPILMSRPEFEQFYHDEYKKWGGVIKDAGIRLE